MSAERETQRGPAGGDAAHNGVKKFVRDGFYWVNTSTNTTLFILRTPTDELLETESL